MPSFQRIPSAGIQRSFVTNCSPLVALSKSAQRDDRVDEREDRARDRRHADERGRQQEADDRRRERQEHEDREVDGHVWMRK